MVGSTNTRFVTIVYVDQKFYFSPINLVLSIVFGTSGLYMPRALLCTMANTNKHPEKYAWWINELNSLGVKVEDNNEIVDVRQLENLVDDMKQAHIREYKEEQT